MKSMDKKEQIIELIKEYSWHNIPVKNTVDKIFFILNVSNRRELLSFVQEVSEWKEDYSSTRLKLKAKELVKLYSC